MKKKVLICGATGFIGRNLTEQLSKRQDFDVHAVRYNHPAYECANVTWHQADLRNPTDIEHIIGGTDILIQAAGTTSGAKERVGHPEHLVTDNAVMNSYLFRAAYEHKLQHVIFLSCTEMYPSAEFPLKEIDYDANQPLHRSHVGTANTKLYLEKMCEFYASISETKFTAIRHSHVYGPHANFDLETSHVFGATIAKVITAKDKITVWGTGEESRDLIYVDDLVAFIESALDKQQKNFRIYNCGYGHAIAIRDLVKKIIAHSGKKLEIQHDLLQPTIKTSLYLNCDLAKEELGWSPTTSLDDGIKKTMAWYIDNYIVKEPTPA